MNADQMLWYRKAAEDYDQALPVGCGRLGGMLYGGAAKELIRLNEDSIYSGGRRSRLNPAAYEGVQEIRRLLLEERIEEAETLAFQKYRVCRSIPGTTCRSAI